MHKRLTAAALIVAFSLVTLLLAAEGNQTATTQAKTSQSAASLGLDIKQLERERMLNAANVFLHDEPITVTAAQCPRSAGRLHDFYSEGDYWWPNPANPDGPYIQCDGMTNPDNFVEHRRAMVRLSLIVPALAAAWKITKQRKYSDHAAKHLRSWFMDDATKMNPSLLYSQAIKGRFTGRGIGIIDTLHLVEVARAASRLGLPPIGSRRREGVVHHLYELDEHSRLWNRRA